MHRKSLLSILIVVVGFVALGCQRRDENQNRNTTLDGLPGWTVEWTDSLITVREDGRSIASIWLVRGIDDHKTPGRIVHAYDDVNPTADSLQYLTNTAGAIAAFRNVKVNGKPALVVYDYRGRIEKIVSLEDDRPISMDEFMRDP